MLLAFALVALLESPLADSVPSPEARIVAYLLEHVKPGERVLVSDLYSKVFTQPEERAALDRMFDSFFKIPLFVAQYQKVAGRPPSVQEIAQQFRFEIPGQADLMLRIMESDPRMPRFMTRSAKTGEIESVDVEAILAHPRFGKLVERTLAGVEGGPARPFAIPAYDGSVFRSESLAGRPHLLYFWFSGCPPCVETTPLLVELHKAFAPRGFEVLAVNADRVLEIPASDEDRAAYAERVGMRFPQAHMTAEMQEAYGQVSVFPTLFLVDRTGSVVRHFVAPQEKPVLEAAVWAALQ